MTPNEELARKCATTEEQWNLMAQAYREELNQENLLDYPQQPFKDCHFLEMHNRLQAQAILAFDKERQDGLLMRLNENIALEKDGPVMTDWQHGFYAAMREVRDWMALPEPPKEEG